MVDAARLEPSTLTVAPNVLLTGAGYTHNFGGFLAAEMWAQIFNHPAVQAAPALRTRFLQQHNFDFEELYAKEPKGINNPDYVSLSAGLQSAYEQLDQISRDAQFQPNHRIGLNNLQSWLRHFDGRQTSKGFVFSLNQDLLIERSCHGDSFLPVLPGVPNAGQCLEVRKTTQLVRVDLPDVEINSVKGNLHTANLVKLHGSSNWKTRDGGGVMVIGRDKPDAIAGFSILAAYWRLFREVLERPGMSLWSVGYGFGDNHVNEIIREAIRNHGLRLYVICPEPLTTFSHRLKGATVWEGLCGYYQASFTDLFPFNLPKPAVLTAIEKVLASAI